jgi:2-polyprenyl-3-methyl-5-hydroxy-6-metoxy-1,4-benzoquinol methylase
MSAPEEAGFPPAKVLMQLISGKCLSRCVSLAAELAIADILTDGPKEVMALAKATGTRPDPLYRVLRTLSAVGVFDELPDRRFRNNRLSAKLISGVEYSVRQYARWSGRELHWRMYSGLETSVRTGQPWAVNEYPDKTPFQVLAEHSPDQEVFNQAMSELSAADGPAIAQAYDFGRFQRIMDIGGGDGTLARLIARKTPQAKVTVLDLPHVIEGAQERLSDDSLSKQIHFKGGSFLDIVPGPADLCVLKHILHDWNDETALRILANCRDALSDTGRVLVCEMVIAPGPEGLAALALDIEMLVGAGGQERTEAEFSELFDAAGLRLKQIICTPTPVRLLEGVRAN